MHSANANNGVILLSNVLLNIVSIASEVDVEAFKLVLKDENAPTLVTL